MAIPYFLMPWSYKTELAGRIAHDLNYPTHIEFFPLFSAQIKGMVFFTRPLLVLGYLIWSWIIFRKYLSSQPDSGIFASQRFMKTWLAILMTSTFILVVSHLTMILIALEGRNIVIFLTINALQISSVIGLTGLLISPFFFPHILYGLPRIPEKILEKNIIAQEEQLVQKVIQPGKHAYETEYLQLIQIKTETCMDEHQPYLNEECNLVSFAKLIDIPAHHLSYYFREISRQPFNEFRNGWRIKHAKKLMQDGKHAELTLEGVGKLSGFASRITFIRAFKKVEGITPGEFASKLKT
jgi:AraC-like DNA-binding protein